MKTSDRGIAALIGHEGVVPAPYYDSQNILTYGVGHTAAAGPPNPAQMQRGMPSDLDAELREVFRVFRDDLAKYEAEVLAAVRVPVAQHEFDALVSFHFNTGGIARAQLTRSLNSGDRAGAAAGFMGWQKPAEIIPRRRAEQALFRDGTYPDTRINVWGATAAGKVVWRPVRVLTPDEALALMRPALPTTFFPLTAFLRWLAGLFNRRT